MKYNPEIHHRRSVRLKNYDYTQAGVYYVTLSSWNREHVFGEIANHKIRLNEFGEIIKKEWLRTHEVRNNIELDEYIIMPNHFHGIITLNKPVGATRWVALDRRVTPDKDRAIHRIAPTTLRSDSIGSVIGQFKSITTKRINLNRNAHGLPVWQRNYYDHIIRNDYDLQRIREYIRNNPLKWDEDEYNQP